MNSRVMLLYVFCGESQKAGVWGEFAEKIDVCLQIKWKFLTFAESDDAVVHFLVKSDEEMFASRKRLNHHRKTITYERIKKLRNEPVPMALRHAAAGAYIHFFL